ncbi:magnesium transporter CorA family protein [Pelagibacterium xiamenense]|uniref:magnesium transporter CorA family protein n=1 Tax=Pelagibacterium xiamenense TaxID=2901140 RepID=UPI001E32A890|nr:magnesium transporter CorA family protein [Pelagibacterium xiamenense]MCD7059473.1 magnesium transporter CorA family protein [Pelagibacterium xiamenense]
MLEAYQSVAGHLQPHEGIPSDFSTTVWVDLHAPSREEEVAVENGLGLSVPTRADMEEIEVSSRLYAEDGNYFMTAILPAKSDDESPELAPVTFVLAGQHLITVRYHDPQPFKTFSARAQRADMGCTDAETVLVGLLETVVDRLADILERGGTDIDALSREIFESSERKRKAKPNFNAVLKALGRKGDINSKIRDSLVTLERLSGYLGHVAMTRGSGKDIRDRIKTLGRDVRSLSDHANFLFQKITFLLDATLGMINIEQNGIIKIFSVAAVIFLPPTLIASIYGMNFDFMPELDWLFGYPFAIGLMAASAGGTFLYFKRRGWL